jgi:hypothetical protein
MPTTDPYLGTPDQFNEIMWKEAAASWRPSGENIFNKRSGEAALTGYIPASAIKAAMRFMLGYEQVERRLGVPPGAFTPPLTDTFCLRRKNPVRHPYYENLWCSGVAEVEFKPDSYTRAALKRATAEVRTGTPAPLGFRTGYKLAKLVARFSPTLVTFREDNADPDHQNLSDDRKEYLRNTVVDTIPRTETFESKLTYVFQEGAGLPPPTTSPAFQTTLAEQGQILVKPDVTVGWKDVPEAWVMRTGTQNPKNVLKALGTLNDSDFLGYERGTLLFVGAELTRNPWTLRPNARLPGAGLESPYLFDLRLMFSFFDPEKGHTGSPAVQITTNRGHNNFPWQGKPDGVVTGSDTNAGKWFYATVYATGDAATGQGLYRYTSYPKIFDCPQNYP